MTEQLPERRAAAGLVLAVCLLLLAGGVVVAGVPSGAVDGTVPGESPHNDIGETIVSSDTPAPQTGGAEIAPELHNATGTVEVVVRFADRPVVHTADVTGLKQRATNAQAGLIALAAERDGLTVVRQFWLMNAALVAVDTDEMSLDRLARLRAVERLHPNYVVTLPEPERAAADRQSAVESAGPATTYGLDQINVTDAWEAFGTRGENATVAVVDTGVDADHPDIDLYTEDPSDPTYPGGWAEFDENGDRIDSQPYDADEHGTHVSGTVAGGNASGEHIGVAPDAELLHTAVLTDCDPVLGCKGTVTQIVAGMEWAVEQDADVMSMSLGGRGPNATFIEPVQNAQSAGTLVVAAAGNDGPDITGSPGDIYDVTSVGASNESEEIAAFSGGREIDTSSWWGENASAHWPDSYVVPDVAAPGVQVKSSIPGGGYDWFNGTSMATPHVSGVAALMISNNSGASPEVLAEALAGSAWKPAGAPDGTDIRYGHGIVDAYHAINLVASGSRIVGTVTSQGSPLPNAVVATDWQRVRTDENGQFELLAPPGTHEVTVSRFGYNTTSRQVTVTEGQSTRVEIATGPVVDLKVDAEQPAVIESGQAVTLSLAAKHLDTLTVELRDGFDEGDATLTVDGRAASFGSPVSFRDYSGTVPITVETSENVRGELGLSITGTGPGPDATLSTGTTTVFENRVDLAIVGDNWDVDNGGGVGLAPELKKSLREYLPLEYTIEITEDASTADEYDVLVVNDLSFVDPGELIDNTGTDNTGIVYLSDLHQYSRMTGTPEEVFRDSDSAGPLRYEVTKQHPVLGGRFPGDAEVINDNREPNHIWFENASGEVVAAISANGVRKGPVLAVDDANNTVLAGSLGYNSIYPWKDYTPAAHRIIRSAVKYVTPDRFDVETLELGFAPYEAEIRVDQQREIEIFAKGLDAPISAYDLTVDVENPESVEVVDARLAGDPSLSEVVIADGGSQVTLTAIMGDSDEVTPRFPIATLTVRGAAEGVGELVLTDVDITKPDGSSHRIKNVDAGTITVTEVSLPPPGVGDDPPQDLDDDGLYEDVNGDGRFSVGDVQALFDHSDDPSIQQYPRLFNFDREEPPAVTVSDLQALWQLLQDQD